MKSMFGYMPYQPYALLQAISTLWSVTNHLTPATRYTHTLNGLAYKVCTTRQGQSHSNTASLSLHKARCTHSGRYFENKML